TLVTAVTSFFDFDAGKAPTLTKLTMTAAMAIRFMASPRQLSVPHQSPRKDVRRAHGGGALGNQRCRPCRLVSAPSVVTALYRERGQVEQPRGRVGVDEAIAIRVVESGIAKIHRCLLQRRGDLRGRAVR